MQEIRGDHHCDSALVAEFAFEASDSASEAHAD
jgi:hypothetical protein